LLSIKYTHYNLTLCNSKKERKKIAPQVKKQSGTTVIAIGRELGGQVSLHVVESKWKQI